MTLKNIYIIITILIIIMINYGIFYFITNNKKEKTISHTVLNIENKTKINASINKPIEIIKKDDSIQDKIKKPLLSIIIDDVSFSQHLRYVDMVDIPLNLSFLPPTNRHKKSHLLASDYSQYMVHLPLNAINYHASEVGTLYDDSSYEDIDKTIKLIRSLFPKAKYINNHTGSKFTSNLEAMSNLAIALEKYNFTFVDSVTTGKTQSKNAFGHNVLSRDVFLDNENNIEYIKKQIRQTVAKSIEQGYAIAIGHPRFNTLKAIQEMSDYIQEYTEVVYIDEIDNAVNSK